MSLELNKLSQVNGVGPNTQRLPMDAGYTSIPYEFMGIPLHYEPDFLVHLANDVTLVLEIKGWEDEQDRAKHEAARRWCDAVNNWGELGRWALHVCRDPQLLSEQLAGHVNQPGR